MKPRVAIVGAGAVGGYVGGHMARAGENVILIDPWAEHIDYIKRHGLHLSGTQGEHTVQVQALHLYEVQSLHKAPVDIAFICTKSYDTAWATTLIKDYLSPHGFVVSLQNSINEECIAGIVGWGRTLGCIASTIGVEAYKPGHIMRTLQPGGAAYTVFRVGEVHGRITARAQEVARLLSAVDSAKVTTNLWGERWTKLVVNAMGNGLSAVTGMNSLSMYTTEATRRLMIRLAGEAIRVGQALGYEIEAIRGLPPEKWVAAAEGEPAALEEVEGAMLAATQRMTEAGRPSTAQDILKGRRTEIDFINGLVAAKGEEAGVPAPTHAALTALVKRVERGELAPSPGIISYLNA
ncbi:MAG: 2-dehydropantoate 2-reductase [Candidatus Tectimicrobiota bacterium]|nr:MAG: 2-dehydropantoate 2-reductase [Candidatus Tectomicrobia bacterium]